jgi:hypothetical protein
VSLSARSELLGWWYSGSGVLVLSGRRMLTRTVSQAIRVVVRRFGPETQRRAA